MNAPKTTENTHKLRGTTRALSVAPMMAKTDRHFRYFMRRLTQKTLLYTEMVTMNAVLFGDRERLIGFNHEEKPLALQLGGDDPVKLAECARIAEGMGYDEVNINVGCPSERVQSGGFGAALMKDPPLVARAVEAMSAAVSIPITVKNRIGVDELDRYEDLLNFVEVVSAAGADRFTIHARKAWLKGLSPKENRNIPPLRYGDVHRLKVAYPHLPIEINGGIKTLAQAQEQLKHVDAVMIGRAAYEDSFIFAKADQEIFGLSRPSATRREIVESMYPYIERLMKEGAPLGKVTRHMLTLFAYETGTRAWKRHLSENSHQPESGVEVVKEALRKLEAAQDRAKTFLNEAPMEQSEELDAGRS